MQKINSSEESDVELIGGHSGSECDSDDSSSDENEPHVVQSNTKPRGRRKWDTYNYCMYCGIKQTQLKRHLNTYIHKSIW